MASKNIKHQPEAQKIENAEWVADMHAVRGTGTSAGRRDNIVMSHIRA
jgi:hypothetical protein